MSDIVKGVVAAGRSAGRNYLKKVVRRIEREMVTGDAPLSGHRHLPLFRTS